MQSNMISIQLLRNEIKYDISHKLHKQLWLTTVKKVNVVFWKVKNIEIDVPQEFWKRYDFNSSF